MTRFTAVLFALCIFAVPAFAADAPTAVTGSLAWQNGDDTGRTWAGTFALDFPVFSIFSIGPVLEARYWSSEVNPDPDDTGSLTLFNIGGQAMFYFTTSHDGPNVGAEVLYVSDDASGYLVVPFVGLDFGIGDGKGADALFRARFSHPLHYGTDHGDTVDLERDELTVGFGARW